MAARSGHGHRTAGHGLERSTVTTGERREKRGAAAPTTGRACTSTTPSTCSSRSSPGLASDRRPGCSTSPAVRGSPCASLTPWARPSPASTPPRTSSPSRVSEHRRPTSASVRCTRCRGPTNRSTPPCRSTASGAAAMPRSTKRSACSVPGGLIGISFWGNGPPLDIRNFFRIFAVHAPQEHRGSMRQLNNISIPGVAEEMLAASGFSVLERGGRTSVIEWPDAEIAWRAISSLGPAVPALRTNDPIDAQARGARRTRAVSRPTRHLPHAKRPTVRARPEAVMTAAGGLTATVRSHR